MSSEVVIVLEDMEDVEDIGGNTFRKGPSKPAYLLVKPVNPAPLSGSALPSR